MSTQCKTFDRRRGRPAGVRDRMWAGALLAMLILCLPGRGYSQAVPPGHPPCPDTGSIGHIFWVIPAFNVTCQATFKPLTTREKFGEWFEGTYDPRGLVWYAFLAATVEHSSKDGYCGYGKGWGGYGKCLGSMELEANTSSFLGDFLLPSLLHQDPRYFRLGRASFGTRSVYAVSRVFVTYSDDGHWVFNSSALSGTAISAGLSNLYFPKQEVGWGPSVGRAAIDIGNTALYNLAAEFWPDIETALHHVF